MILDRSNDSSRRRVQWRMLGKLGNDCMGDLQRSTTMATTRLADGLAHEPIVHVRRRRCCWATIRLCSLCGWARARCRDDEAAFVAVELGFGLALRAAATLLPRSCPATPDASPLLSQALTTDCIPPHNSSLLEQHLILHSTSRPLPSQPPPCRVSSKHMRRSTGNLQHLCETTADTSAST